MAPQDVFRALPPEIRAMALAGHYLQSFALMEAALNSAIGAALKLDSLQELVVCKNIQLRDKIKIARTLVSLAFAPKEDKEVYDKALIRIGTLSNDRNIVAHDLFFPDDEGEGIEFLVTKATARLQFPRHKWTVDQVEQRSDELRAIRETLAAMKTLFKASEVFKALMSNENAQARILASTPITALYGQDYLDQAPHQAPSDQDLPHSETTNAKAPEAQEEPRE